MVDTCTVCDLPEAAHNDDEHPYTHPSKVGCTVCNTPEAEHGFRKHPFVPPGEPLVLPQQQSKKEKQQRPQLIITPAPDLVLRRLLLRKGLITTEELEAVENELTLGTLGIRVAGEAADVHPDPNSGS